jgi:hypothetical protein
LVPQVRPKTGPRTAQLNGKAVVIIYRRSVKGQQFSENEVEILLNSNSGGVPWQKGEGLSWETENGALLANHSVDHMLMIGTRDFLTREKAKDKAKESHNLEGF